MQGREINTCDQDVFCEEGLIVLTYTQMVMILDGISIISINKKERYLPKEK